VTEQSDVLRHVIEVLERCEIDYMLVGSWASGLYGEPRFTQDIDFVVALPGDAAIDLGVAVGRRASIVVPRASTRVGQAFAPPR